LTDSSASEREVSEDWTEDFDGHPFSLAKPQFQQWIEMDESDEYEELSGTISESQLLETARKVKEHWLDWESDSDELSDFESAPMSGRILTNTSNTSDSELKGILESSDEEIAGVRLSGNKIVPEEFTKWMDSENDDLDSDLEGNINITDKWNKCKNFHICNLVNKYW